MIRLLKPARSKNSMRGFFSYITESVINIYNASNYYKDNSLKVYYDLNNIPGYGSGNIFNICFEQDINDYEINKSEYINIESIPSNVFFDPYDDKTFNNIDLSLTELIIKKHLKLNNETIKLFNERSSQINFEKTIGFHRRSTDMSGIHGIRTIPINDIFLELEYITQTISFSRGTADIDGKRG